MESIHLLLIDQLMNVLKVAALHATEAETVAECDLEGNPMSYSDYSGSEVTQWGLSFGLFVPIFWLIPSAILCYTPCDVRISVCEILNAVDTPFIDILWHISKNSWYILYSSVSLCGRRFARVHLCVYGTYSSSI